jgi:hypothetical protein
MQSPVRYSRVKAQSNGRASSQHLDCSHETLILRSMTMALKGTLPLFWHGPDSLIFRIHTLTPFNCRVRYRTPIGPGQKAGDTYLDYIWSSTLVGLANRWPAYGSPVKSSKIYSHGCPPARPPVYRHTLCPDGCPGFVSCHPAVHFFSSIYVIEISLPGLSCSAIHCLSI